MRAWTSETFNKYGAIVVCAVWLCVLGLIWYAVFCAVVEWMFG